MLDDVNAFAQGIRRIVSDRLDLTRSLSDDDIRETISEVIAEKSHERYISLVDKKRISDGVFNAMRGLDVLQPLVDDPSVTEIMINGAGNIFIERDGKVSKSGVSFENSEKLYNVINNICSQVNRTATESEPIVDARLKDGSRVNVVLDVIALSGHTVTIRKFPEDPMTVKQLIAYKSITPEAADFLERLVRAKYNIFISGGTGSGKTTFLNALSNFIPHDERVITIEDSAELQIRGVDNLVRLETRNANMEGKGEISIRDLIKASLRMRPERIVVGEVRGPEALDMLQAMNTGHDGSLSTGHANSTKDILSRLETMVISGTSIPLEAVRQQIASAIDIIIQLSRLRDKSRRTLEICEVLGYERGEIQLNPLYKFQETGEDADKKIIGGLARTQNPMANTLKFRMAGIDHKV